MRDGGLGSWPARRRRTDPDLVAIRHHDRALTYGELDDRVNRAANALAALGVARGDRVACLAANSPLFLEALFATARLGAIFVGLNTRLAAPEIATQLADCSAAVLLHDADRADRAAAAHAASVRAISEAEFEDLVAAAAPDVVDEPIALDDPCLILYTSGTTGAAKGVVLSHGNLTWNAVNVLLEVDLQADEVAVITTPMFHSAALSMNALPLLLKGATLVLARAATAQEILGLVERWSATHVQAVPAVYRTVVDSPLWQTAELRSLRRVVSGGSAAPAGLIQHFLDRGIRFFQGYGMTETAPGALYLGAARAATKIGSVGRPMFFTDVRAVDAAGAATPPGVAGELVVHGPNVMSGYWNRPADTAGAFTDDGWYRSGDIGVFDEDGDGYIVGRAKDMFVSGGENVYPAEVEAVLDQHPAVGQSAVIAEPHERWGEVGRAVVELADGAAEADLADLLDFAATRLAKYKVPKTVVVVDRIPHTATGKINKIAVRERWGEMGDVGEPGSAPSAQAPTML